MNKRLFKVSILFVISGIILIITTIVIGAPLSSQTGFSSVLMFTLLLLGFSETAAGVTGLILGSIQYLRG